MKSKLFGTATIAALAFGLQPAVAQTPIKIGFISTFSGPQAAIGEDMRRSVELAKEHLGGKMGGVPFEIVYEDDQCLAFRDIKPGAPTHVLVIPKQEIASVDALTEADGPLLAHLWLVIAKVARDLGLAGGYRVVVNCGPDGGQSVDHLHFHILGGRKLNWPPG